MLHHHSTGPLNRLEVIDTKIRESRPLAWATHASTLPQFATSPQRHFTTRVLEIPHKMVPLTPRQKRDQQNEKARKLLAGANHRRDDSDDEDEYEWIYQREGDESGNEDDDGATSKNRKRQSVASKQEETIIGAKKGGFKCMIGDSVLLRAEDGNPSWVGMILSFLEDEDGDMAADFLCIPQRALFKEKI
jgi:hypothetical protein